MSVLRIAVDAMGGDLGVQATVPAVVKLAKQYPEIQFQLYGESAVSSELPSELLPSNVTLLSTVDSVNMDDSPIYALRHKRHSSMAKSIAAVAENTADGCISAGNTGALVAMGLHFLKTYKGIDRPALCQAIPTAQKHSYMLDLGANVDCSAKQLQQFAYLGTALCQVLDGHVSPEVRLLNIGSESFKGPSVVKEAADLLQHNDNLNYQGFIEGDEIYRGVTNVIVCDGFAGNIALKASEGVAKFVTNSFRQVFKESLYNRLMSLLSKPALRRWQVKMNPDRYNGAYLLGLKGTVVKSHGGANEYQFACALEMLIQQLQKQHICSMEHSLTAIMAQ
jgi:glycerol-3-phosphate acyltransferase PlsX